jgi:hypothetical protein
VIHLITGQDGLRLSAASGRLHTGNWIKEGLDFRYFFVHPFVVNASLCRRLQGRLAQVDL